MQQVRDNIGTVRAQLLGAGFPPLGDDDVRNLQVPVLLFIGEQSVLVLRRLGDRLAEVLPDVERVVVPVASRLVHKDDPLLVNKTILEFLTRKVAHIFR